MSTAYDLILRRARVDGHEGSVDIALQGDRIAVIAAEIPQSAPEELPCDGRVVTSAFVDPHIHLDKVATGAVLPPNRSGTLGEAISLLHAVKRSATVEDIAERAGTIIRKAVAAGTTFLRSHVDVDPIGGLKPLEGVARARDEHNDLCDIQIVAFPQEGIERAPGTKELLREAMQVGADVVGGMPHWEATPAAARRHIEFCMDLAERFDANVDMHVDETDDPESRTLEMLVRETERRGWGGRVSASHCCAMAAWEDAYATEVIEGAARVGVSVITNPATNLLLQGRGDAEPRRRGIPRVKELLAAGVRMACGQDCVDDAFYPFGAADQLQVALILCHAAQLSTPDEISWALRMIGADAAEIVGIDRYELRQGGRADLVVLDAEGVVDALRSQVPRRWVIRRGTVVSETIHEQRLVGRADGRPARGRQGRLPLRRSATT